MFGVIAKELLERNPVSEDSTQNSKHETLQFDQANKQNSKCC